MPRATKSLLSRCRRPIWILNNVDSMISENIFKIIMMTSSNENIFRVTGLLRGKFSGHRWLPLTNASDAELWCLLLCAPEQTVEQIIEAPVWFETQSRSLWRHCNDIMKTAWKRPLDFVVSETVVFHKRRNKHDCVKTPSVNYEIYVRLVSLQRMNYHDRDM